MANETKARKSDTAFATKTSTAIHDGSELSDAELDQVSGGTDTTTTTTVLKKISDTADSTVQNMK